MRAISFVRRSHGLAGPLRPKRGSRVFVAAADNQSKDQLRDQLMDQSRDQNANLTIRVSWHYGAGKWLLAYPPRLESASQELYRMLVAHSPDEEGFLSFWRDIELLFRAKGISLQWDLD